MMSVISGQGPLLLLVNVYRVKSELNLVSYDAEKNMHYLQMLKIQL